jgi:hypothetical protein
MAELLQKNVDLIAHKYPLIEAVVSIDGIRMAGLKDIAAMKIDAVGQSLKM